MEPGGSLLHSQMSATCPYPKYQSGSEASCVNTSQQDMFLWVFSSSPNPQTGGVPLVSCLWLLIQYIRGYPPYWRPFLLSQHEDVP